MFEIDLNIYVNGNFEFTKVMTFNIICSFILFFFLLEKILKKDKIYIPNLTYPFIAVIIASTIFSISPITSLFGGTVKGHGAFFFINLIGLFIVLSHQSHHTLKRYLKITLLSSFLVAFLGIWQYILPSFDYGDLSNRAISTLGHPNYLALYFLIILPLLYKKLVHRFSHLYLGFTILIIACLLLTKSMLGIGLFILYNLYFFQKNKKETLISVAILITIGIIACILIDPGFGKLHSFLSRFALWDTTLRIILSDWKTLIFGGGLETLLLSFDTAKSPYVYIYENFGFIADRPHNLILNIFYHTGLIGLCILSYVLFHGWNHIKKTPYKESLALFFLFTMLNFPSVVHYSILALIIAIATHKKSIEYTRARSVVGFISFIAMVLVSILGGYFSYQFYQAEIAYMNGNTQKSVQIFPYHPTYHYNLGDYEEGVSIERYTSKRYYKSKIRNLDEIIDTCGEFTEKFPTAENYFYCADTLERLSYKEESLVFYKKGLDRLPDLWNPDSQYYKDIFIKNTINGNRFFSEKYSPVKEVLEKVGK